MQINTNNLISITEANQNFSKVARTVDVFKRTKTTATAV